MYIKFQDITLDLMVDRGSTIPRFAAETFRHGLELTLELGSYPGLDNLSKRARVSASAIIKRERPLFRQGTLGPSRKPRRIDKIAATAVLDPPEALTATSFAGVIEADRFIERRIDPVAPDDVTKLPTIQAFGLADTNVSANVERLRTIGIIQEQDDGLVLNRNVWRQNKLIYLSLAQSPVESFEDVRREYSRDQSQKDESEIDVTMHMMKEALKTPDECFPELLQILDTAQKEFPMRLMEAMYRREQLDRVSSDMNKEEIEKAVSLIPWHFIDSAFVNYLCGFKPYSDLCKLYDKIRKGLPESKFSDLRKLVEENAALAATWEENANKNEAVPFMRTLEKVIEVLGFEIYLPMAKAVRVEQEEINVEAKKALNDQN